MFNSQFFCGIVNIPLYLIAMSWFILEPFTYLNAILTTFILIAIGIFMFSLIVESVYYYDSLSYNEKNGVIYSH